MSVRSELAAAITADESKPPRWEIFDRPRRLPPFTDPSWDVAIVIEQRGLMASRFSSDGVEIPVEISVSVWVVVDGSRGDDDGTIEDRLEEAAEAMIRILEPLAAPVWDGTAERTSYDEQKPAYQFPLRVIGKIVENPADIVHELVKETV